VTASGESFFMMEKIAGTHFLELSDRTEEKKDCATAILTLELNNIFRGRFDNDRHGGNVRVDGNKIGHFDFKAMSTQEWDQEGYDQFASLLFTALLKMKTPDELMDLLLDEERKLKEGNVVITPFVMEAQKALLSLGEYSRCLSAEDLQRVFVSALRQDINPKMKAAILKQCPEALSPFIEKFLESGASGEENGVINPLPFSIDGQGLVEIKRRA